DSGCTLRIDTTVAERRCRSWTSPGIRFIEPGIVAVSPDRLACLHIVAGNDFFLTTLFLCIEAPVLHCKGRPRRSNRSAPELDWRRRSPVGFDSNSVNNAITLRSTK